jgi:hypothetical protein
LPTEATARKAIPIATGFVDYFPDAMAEVAELSRVGNEQHNPGKPLHWDRSKSGDESDALMRHFVQRGTRDTDGIRHTAKVAWRAMALLQKEIEAERAARRDTEPAAPPDERQHGSLCGCGDCLGYTRNGVPIGPCLICDRLDCDAGKH